MTGPVVRDEGCPKMEEFAVGRRGVWEGQAGQEDKRAACPHHLAEHRQECLCHSGLEVFSEGVEGVGEDGGAEEGLKFFRRVHGLDGFAAFLHEFLCDGHGFFL